MLDSNEDKITIIALCNMISGSHKVGFQLSWIDVIPSLISLLNSSDWEIRKTVVYTLGRLDVQAHFLVLAAVIKNDTSNYVRMFAIDAVSHWRSPETASVLIPIAEDKSQDIEVRETAIEALGVSNSNIVINSLIGLLRDENSVIRHTAIIALNNTQNPVVIQYLEKLLTDQTITKYGTTITYEAQRVIDYLRTK